MAGRDYFHDDDADRKLGDTYGAPALEQGESTATGAGRDAPQSLAEIDAQYGGPAAATADTGGPDLDQLSLHGVAPEASHVDPATTAVAQAELETGTGAAAPREPAADAGDTAGPEIGTVSDPMPPEDKAGGAHDAVPASPAAVLGGAAQGLGTAAEAATPGAAAATAAPMTTAAAPATAAGSPHDGGHAGAPSRWQDSARAYNQGHGLVEAFNAATHNACGTGAEADPDRVAAWQSAHGLSPDGRIGHLTLGAASGPAGAKTEAPHTEPAHAEAAHAEAAHAKTVEPAAHAPVTKPAPVTTPASAPTAAPATADSFTGTDDIKGPGKDRWTSYGKDENKTYGWDLGGTHGVKNSGGDAGAAIYAVSNVEGRYDSVQTYDAGILSFGIMQWTLHAGSLQRFLGFLKDKSGPEGRAAFQDDFAAKGIDVKPTGGQYQLSYNGKEYALGEDGAGKAAIEKLVRDDKATARKWSEIFAAAGADSRVQKAQFEHAKAMFKETQGITFGNKIVDQSLKACKNTFHAKYRELYGKAEGWMSASPKAAALFFSMRVNNPKYANAAFLKAIDAFYDAHGTDRAKWPSNWGEHFGSLVADKSAETLSSWGKEDGNEGRVDKTLRFWNKAQAGTPASSTAAPATAHAPATTVAAKAAKPDAGPEAAADAGRQKKLRAQYAVIMKQYGRGQIDQGGAIKSLITYDQKLNGGTTSIEGLVLLPILLADLIRVSLTRSTSAAPAKQAPVTDHKATAPAEHKATPPAEHKVTAPAEHKAAQVPATTTTAHAADVTRPPATLPAAARPATAEVTPEAEHIEPHVITVGAGEDEQKVLVYVSPGKLTATPDIFMFLHGFDADYGIDPAQHGKDPQAVISGADIAAQAMSRARGKNTVAILPQGVIGRSPKRKDRSDEGGYMKNLQGADSLPTFLGAVLGKLTGQLGGAALSPGHISIAGHSAGGYQGIHSALEGAGKLQDAITDVTLMDSDYAPSHYASTQNWMFKGSPGKTVRIIETPTQFHTAGKSYWKEYFDKSVLKGPAAKHGFTLEHAAEGEKRGQYMTVFQHTRLMKGSDNHCDILILAYDKTHNELRDHHPLRDEVMDDSALSVNQGAAGNETYGKRDHGVLKDDAPAPVAAPKSTDRVVSTSTSKEPAHAEVAPVHAPPAKPHHETAKQEAEAEAQTEAKHAETAAAADHKHDQTPKDDAGHSPDKSTGGKPKAAIAGSKDVYKKGGKLAKEKLTQFNLTDKEYDFKQRVYQVVTSNLGDHIYGGVAEGDLKDCDNGKKIRQDVLPHLNAFLAALRTAITAKEVAHGPNGDIPIGNVTGIQVQSGYRSPEYDMTLWDGQFQATFAETEKVRKATGDPLGKDAVAAFIDVYKWRKAPPGGSNHSNGNAVDLTVLTTAGAIPNHFTDQKAWHKSWAYFWLQEHAKQYGFKNYIKEAWHWEWYG